MYTISHTTPKQIHFSSPEFEPLRMFLMSDALNFGDIVQEDLQAILQKKQNNVQFTGNICSLDISFDTTTIQNELNPDLKSCTIATKTFNKILNEWLN